MQYSTLSYVITDKLNKFDVFVTCISNKFYNFLQHVWPYSGHYHPTKGNLDNFLDFLRESGITLPYEDSDRENKQTLERDITATYHIYETSHIIMHEDCSGRTFTGYVHMPSANIAKEVIILWRGESSHHLWHTVSLKCMHGWFADCPIELMHDQFCL